MYGFLLISTFALAILSAVTGASTAPVLLWVVVALIIMRLRNAQ